MRRHPIMPTPRSSPPTICIAEDRTSCEPALRILVASLARHNPHWPVVLFSPDANEGFRQWLAAYPMVRLNPYPLGGRWTKYDIKPLALLAVLGSGADEAIWLDSDIVVARDLAPLFAGLGTDTVAVTEEALAGGRTDPAALRTRLWNMPVGRTLPYTTNTAVVRVTGAHRPLLEDWHRLLESPPYRAAQDRPWYDRPMHMAGDQEVLTALVSSADHASLPIRFLVRGRDIVQFFGLYGYTVRERAGHLARGVAPLVHSQGLRPWWTAEPVGPGLGNRLARLYDGLSPYLAVARRHADALDDASWLAPVRSARWLTWGHPALTGLPLAAAIDGLRLWRAVRRRFPLSRRSRERDPDRS